MTRHSRPPGGEPLQRLTHYNSDSNDAGRTGPAPPQRRSTSRSTKGAHHVRVGVLELYLPYAPIAADVAASIHRLSLGRITGGLLLLYLALLGITLSDHPRPAPAGGREREPGGGAPRHKGTRAPNALRGQPAADGRLRPRTMQIVTFSNAVCARYGWTRDELLSMSIPDICPPEEGPGRLARSMPSGTVARRSRRRSGRRAPPQGRDDHRHRDHQRRRRARRARLPHLRSART